MHRADRNAKIAAINTLRLGFLRFMIQQKNGTITTPEAVKSEMFAVDASAEPSAAVWNQKPATSKTAVNAPYPTCLSVSFEICLKNTTPNTTADAPKRRILNITTVKPSWSAQVVDKNPNPQMTATDRRSIKYLTSLFFFIVPLNGA